MATQGLPSRWDDRIKYFYRKLAGLGSHRLIDKFEECLDVLRGKKPLVPPYNRADIIDIMRAARYILQEERKIDIGLAREVYEELLKEAEKAMARP